MSTSAKLSANQKGLPARQAGLAPILIVLILVVALGGYFVYKNQTKPAPPQQTIKPTLTPTPTSSQAINWNIKTGSIPQNEEQQLKEAIKLLKIKQDENTILNITSVRIQNDWAVLSAHEENQTQVVQPSEGFQLLARKTQTGWQIVAPNEAGFCQLLNEAPDSLTDKDYYGGCESN